MVHNLSYFYLQPFYLTLVSWISKWWHRKNSSDFELSIRCIDSVYKSLYFSPSPFPAGNDSKIAKIHGWHLKYSSPDPMNQFPATWYNTSIGEGNSICLNKGPYPFLWGDNCEIMSECTLMRQHLKTCFSWISEHFNQTWHKISKGEGDSIVFQQRVNNSKVIALTTFKNLLHNHWANSTKLNQLAFTY